jgi:hypothetical protein
VLIADEMGLGKTLQVHTLSLDHHHSSLCHAPYIIQNLKLIQHAMFWTLFFYQDMVLVVELCA